MRAVPTSSNGFIEASTRNVGSALISPTRGTTTARSAIARELDALDTYVGDRPRLVLDAAMLSLSGRIGVDEASELTPEQVITQIWEDQFFSRPGVRRRVPIG